ncbi:MAG TPA: hypothetical protein VIJ27_08775 [Mucilaginibacter sp.]
MAEIKTLPDEFGVIFEANKNLPSADLKIKFIEALAELEDNTAHKTRQFPKTRLHKVVGVKQTIYRADIDKISGWRIHVQYADKQLHLKDIINGQLHDDVVRVIQSKKNRYV